MSKQFRRIGANHPGRSVFDLTHEVKTSCEMGQLVPVLAKTVIPGDVFNINHEVIVRLQPLVAPVLHEVNVYIHNFFVPKRLLWEDFEDYYTGGTEGDFSEPQPRWIPVKNGVGTLWDYFSFPVGVNPAGKYPLDYPRRAYNMIYNEYYRDQNLIEEVPLDNEDVLYRCWEKDYFTSALPWQQRGTPLAVPLEGYGKVEFEGSLPYSILGAYTSRNNVKTSSASGQFDVQLRSVQSIPTPPREITLQSDGGTVGNPLYTDTGIPAIQLTEQFRNWLHQNHLDLETVTTFDVNDLRTIFAVQRWMERSARAGARFPEALKGHFGVSPRDDRLQRPEYIGGMKTPIIISEVLQTSSTNNESPQGNLAGHGITANRNHAGKYRAVEPGVIIGIMSIMPRTTYQQGIDREWLIETRYDEYFPEFANLGEQGIYNAELCATDDENRNNSLFGYQGRYDEYRTAQNKVTGHMRNLFNYWHFSRIFDINSPPELNGDFVTCKPRKDPFAVQNEHSFLVNVANVIRAVRPMPIMSNPGLIDH